MGSLWSPIKESGSLTDRIVARLDELIRSEDLQEGQRLPSEREMARLLGVSRPALREAVRVLEARGRVVVRHGQGVFVGAGDQAAIRSRLASMEVSLAELFAMRQVLEVPAAQWAAGVATPRDIESLGHHLEAEEKARVEPIDFAVLRQLDTAFHLRIVEMAKNRFLLQTQGVLQEMINSGMETTLTIPGRVDQARKDHRKLFEAIRDRDASAARAAAEAHIEGARDAALARIHREQAEAARNDSGADGTPGSHGAQRPRTDRKPTDRKPTNGKPTGGS
jgi:GntR family transcriptional repressor for pyruvate dehydrogenase complex